MKSDVRMKEETRFRFVKAERLRHKRLVDDLFASGESLYDFPLRLTWRLLDADALRCSFRDGAPPKVGQVQMLVTVPKKKRRHAVDRVLMRRRIREAYRLNSHVLKECVASLPMVGTLSLAFVYIHKENLDYAYVERKMARLLRKLSGILSAREEAKSIESCE